MLFKIKGLDYIKLPIPKYKTAKKKKKPKKTKKITAKAKAKAIAKVRRGAKKCKSK